MREIIKNKKSSQILEGKVVALLFLEPSTRTRGSTDAGIKRLGGQTILFVKNGIPPGDTLEITIRKIEESCDAIIIRHPDPGSANKAAEIASVPVINAGDGKG